MVGGTRVRVLVAMVAAVLLPGCWLQIGAGPGHTWHQPFDGGLTADNVDTLHEVWSVEVPGSLSEPMVSEGRVFVTRSVTTSAAVRAVDAATGETLWDTGLVSVPSVSGAFATGTPVTFVGDRLWSGYVGFVPLAPGRPTPGPACTLGSVGLDPETGASSPTGSSFPSPAVSAGPVVARVLVTVTPLQPCASSTPTIELEVTGAPAGGWRTAIPGSLLSTFEPALTAQRVLLAHGPSLDSFAVDCTADCLQWTTTFDPAVSRPVVEGDGPIFVTSGEDLIALDQTDGAELWRAPLGGYSSGLALANGTVYVSTRTTAGAGQALVAFDAGGCGSATCEPLWEGALHAGGAGQPVVGGGVVYLTSGPAVLAFDAGGCGAATCSTLAEIPVPGGGQLSLSDGRLFVAGNGRLTALAPE